jgi:DNA-binding HxlR family transcriptional regulator
MVRTDFTQMRCPVARSMAVLGERWAMLVLRDCFYGTTRFDEFERNLGIAPNILSARLRELTAHGLLAKTPAAAGRHDYVLTEQGRDFFPAYLALKAWADRWMTGPEGPLVVIEDRATGQPVIAPPVLSAAGTPLRPEDVRIRPGPGAGRATRARFTPDPADPDHG